MDVPQSQRRVEVCDHPLHELFAIDAKSAIRFGKSLVDTAAKLLQLARTQLVPLPHEAQRLANHFAGRLVATQIHFALDELFQFRRQVNVHTKLFLLSVTGPSHAVNVVTIYRWGK
jgi:hypothetical protein